MWRWGWHIQQLLAPRTAAFHSPASPIITRSLPQVPIPVPSLLPRTPVDASASPSPRGSASLYVKLIKESGGPPSQLHAHVLKLGHLRDAYVRNALLSLYAKSGHLHLARLMFDQMPHPTRPDWNSLISACWRWGDPDQARALFRAMPHRNVISWTAMVTGHAQIGDLVHARDYFDRMPHKTAVSWNAMLSAYARNGFHEEALLLFDHMLSAGFPPNQTTWVTVLSSCSARADPSLANSLTKTLFQGRHVPLNCFVKTALLNMYAKCGCLAAARAIFEELEANKNIVTWNAMISAYTRFGDLASARALFDQMPEKDLISWNSMISGYAQNGRSTLAFSLFEDMVACGHPKPDETTFSSVLSACGHLGMLELGQRVVTVLKRTNQIKLHTSGCNSLIFMYSRCGSMEDAMRVFKEMERRDVVSYNTLISGFAAHGLGTKAMELMLRMKEEGIDPDRVTYIGILMACSHAGLLQEGRQIFETIKAPSVDHYACMVDLLGRMGELEGAKTLIQIMPMEPHAGVYGSLLNACCIHRRVDLAEMAGNKLLEIEPNNSGNYVLLSNVYSLARRWEDADMVRQVMRERRVAKAVGWSWVEHKGKLHMFNAGDRSHERCDDIHELLANLAARMRKCGHTADGDFTLKDVVEEDREEMVGVHSEK